MSSCVFILAQKNVWEKCNTFILIFFILQLISAWMGGSRMCTYVSIPVCFK